MKKIPEKLQIQIYGESHAPKIGVRIYGIPKSEEINLDDLRAMLMRRRSGNNVWSTPRKESDEVVFLSGVEITDNTAFTDGNVLEACIVNSDIRQSDYLEVQTKPRPSHADYVSFVRDGKISTGGGRFSGRMTAPLCIAGGIAEQILFRRGIELCAYISQIGTVCTGSYINNTIALEGLDKRTIERLKGSDFPLLDVNAESAAEEQIKLVSSEHDSLGGAIECIVAGIGAGALGDSLFDGLESKISAAVFAVPAVKGVEFGDGFALCAMRGSVANDPFTIKGGQIVTATNRSGGINGGISNGMPLLVRAAVRPTPSIARQQHTVDLQNMSNSTIAIKGRHDACIVPRAVPCVESAIALALLDEVLSQTNK